MLPDDTGTPFSVIPSTSITGAVLPSHGSGSGGGGVYPGAHPIIRSGSVSLPTSSAARHKAS